MKRRVAKKHDARVWAWIKQLNKRALGRHDRWSVIAAHLANPWKFVGSRTTGLFVATYRTAPPVRSTDGGSK